jgi:hypothetical protein
MTNHHKENIGMSEQDTPQSLVKIDTTIGMDEVAAVKVARIEHACLTRQEELRAALKDSEAKVVKLEEGLLKAIPEDTRDEHLEIGKLEAALKSFFGKDACISIAMNGDKVSVSALHCSRMVTLKGAKSKAITKELEQVKKDVVAAEDGLCTVKKQLTQMGSVERFAKAAVAEARLMQSDAGRAMLAHMEKVTLPGLPAPKK